MIDEIEWDGLLHEYDVDRASFNWCNKFMEVISIYLYSKTIPETQEECAMAYKEYISADKNV